jgi:hypothetical protein
LLVASYLFTVDKPGQATRHKHPETNDFKSFFLYFIFIYIFAAAKRHNGLVAERLKGGN